MAKMWKASVARCFPDRAYRLCCDSEHLRIIVGTCKISPITVVQYRAKEMPLLRVSILFRPPS